MSDLRRWWLEMAENEIERTVPKAEEYGATDLVAIGRVLAACMGRRGVTDADATELAIFFYMVGKMARWEDAVRRGDKVSDDTLFDIGVYVRMAQRNRSHGGWPGESTKSEPVRSGPRTIRKRKDFPNLRAQIGRKVHVVEYLEDIDSYRWTDGHLSGVTPEAGMPVSISLSTNEDPERGIVEINATSIYSIEFID
jgi:hypothetical protein